MKRDNSIIVYLERSLTNEEGNYNGNDSYTEEHIIETSKAVTVQDVLRRIYRYSAPTLAFRDYNCFAGKCGGCRVRVNGREALACSTLISPGETVMVAPSKKGEMLRDLVVIF